jgi:predicted amidophosphoribosyltransferase
MKRLGICPNCHSEMELDDRGIEYCKVCNYWTREGTARLEPLIIFS